MLEFDGPPIDPAIISAQPMKPAPNMELPQMVCPPGRFPLSNNQLNHFKPISILGNLSIAKIPTVL